MTGNLTHIKIFSLLTWICLILAAWPGAAAAQEPGKSGGLGRLTPAEQRVLTLLPEPGRVFARHRSGLGEALGDVEDFVPDVALLQFSQDQRLDFGAHRSGGGVFAVQMRQVQGSKVEVRSQLGVGF